MNTNSVIAAGMVLYLLCLPVSSTFSQELLQDDFVAQWQARYLATKTLYVKVTGDVTYSAGYFSHSRFVSPDEENEPAPPQVPIESLIARLRYEMAFDAASRSYLCSTLSLNYSDSLEQFYPWYNTSCIQGKKSWCRTVVGDNTHTTETFKQSDVPAQVSYHVSPQSIHFLYGTEHEAAPFSLGHLLLTPVQDETFLFTNTTTGWQTECTESNLNDDTQTEKRLTFRFTPADNSGNYRELKIVRSPKKRARITYEKYSDQKLYTRQEIEYASDDFERPAQLRLLHRLNDEHYYTGDLFFEVYERNKPLPAKIFAAPMYPGETIFHYDESSNVSQRLVVTPAGELIPYTPKVRGREKFIANFYRVLGLVLFISLAFMLYLLYGSKAKVLAIPVAGGLPPYCLLLCILAGTLVRIGCSFLALLA